MKRKAEEDIEVQPSKQAKKSTENYLDRFREGLFEHTVLDSYQSVYATSEPYRHGVISDLINPDLLRKVRSEIQNLSFTPKETDIYKIHQSGDLANLDGLDDSSLKVLPSLLNLRDAMYSAEFRTYLSGITGSGLLSGKKTDMAINLYIPGCHLLCHDDVIGSRRVSYILYLTDPDRPWQKEWGGALRLYPTKIHSEENGKETKAPSPEPSISIPPAFNQLSFFAVQPGESFHDVEEVFADADSKPDDKDGSRVRMAISGWYHIPQEGEEGYIEGLEERLAEKSSLMQLQRKADNYDLPKSSKTTYEKFKETDTPIGLPTPSSQDDILLSESDLTFLLDYIAPTYLTPDTLESISNIFGEECELFLETFLSQKFSDSIREYILEQESQTLPTTSREIEASTSWTVARPPHKHRFLFQQAVVDGKETSPIVDFIKKVIPSDAFQKWLSLATDYKIESHSSLARRFRRGHDYTLATGYDEDSPRIEICLSITPTTGWGDDQTAEPEDDTESKDTARKEPTDKKVSPAVEDPGVGGYLTYMAGEEDDDQGTGSTHGVETSPNLDTGARPTQFTSQSKTAKHDPAIYKASGDEEDDGDGVLFSMPAGWNRLGIVLRDKGTMRFVKYVSQMAKGDRWDVFGEFDVIDEGEEEGGGEDEGKGERSEKGVDQKSDIEESSTEILEENGDSSDSDDL